MDETIDMSGFYTDPWAGAYDTGVSNFDPSLYDTSSLYGNLGGLDFTAMFGDPTGGMDYSSLFGTAPDYTSMFTDPMAYLQDTTTPTINDAGLSLSDIIGQANAPIAQSLSSSVMPNALTGDFGQSMPSSSYVDQGGGVVGLTSSGADTNNVYQYMTGPSGDTFVMDTATGKAVGYLDSNNQPVMYGDTALQNGATLADISNGMMAQPAAQKPTPTGGSGGGGAAPQKPQEQPKTATQSGLAQAALIAQLIAALGAKGVKPPKPDAANNRAANQMSWKRFATGGLNSVSPRAQPSVTGHINHPTGGQDDMVDAKLGGGEYVMDADVVAALGDGNTDAGAAKLDEMRHNVRKHKRSAPADQIPPKAKSPLAYFRGKK